MLQSIRDKTSGWIAYLVIGLISIPFALWGINSYLGGGQEQAAAIVDGDEISVRQLDAGYARYRDRLRQVFGGTLPAAFDNELMLKEQVLGQIIEERVLLNYTDSKGYRVGDQVIVLLADLLVSHFSETGDFVGHIGGDDFIVITESGSVESLARSVQRAFVARTRQFYTEAMLRAGFLESEDRNGEISRFPLVSLAAGLVDIGAEDRWTSEQLSEAASFAKKRAKGSTGFLHRENLARGAKLADGRPAVGE